MRAPERLGGDLRLPTDFYHQFALGQQAIKAPADWPQVELSKWTLRYSPELPVARVISQSGDHVGYLIGEPINAAGLRQPVDLHLPCQAIGDDDDNAVLHSFVNALSGRFLLVLITDTIARVYPDSAGTLSSVYSSRRKRVASTTSLLLVEEPDDPLFRTSLTDYPNGGSEYYYPAGLTPHPEIFRILSDHYLDLKSFELVRFNYRSPITRVQASDAAPLISEIANIIQHNVQSAVRAVTPAYMSLTAGRDSRILLACARQYLGDITFVTFNYVTKLRRRRVDRIDVEVSSAIAAEFGLRHIVIDIDDTPPPGLEPWYMKQVGYATGCYKVRDFYYGCTKHLDTDGVWFNGFGGEIFRGQYWLPDDNETTRLDGRSLASRTSIKQSPEFFDALSSWCSNVKHLDTHSILDLSFIENGLCCLMSPRLYGAAHFRLIVNPFCDSRLFELALRLPVEAKRDFSICNRIIAEKWPELLRFPFNDHIRVTAKIGEWTKWKVAALLRVLSSGASRTPTDRP